MFRANRTLRLRPIGTYINSLTQKRNYQVKCMPKQLAHIKTGTKDLQYTIYYTCSIGDTNAALECIIYVSAPLDMMILVGHVLVLGHHHKNSSKSAIVLIIEK